MQRGERITCAICLNAATERSRSVAVCADTAPAAVSAIIEPMATQRMDLPSVSERECSAPADAASSYSRPGARPIAMRRWRNYRVRVRSNPRSIMGKYVLAWALGVPAIVVVLAYLVFG